MLGAIAILIIGSITTIFLVSSTQYKYPEIMGSRVENSLAITQIDNAGIMIETENLRIYIDPISLNDSYSDKLADIIFITHSHADHFETKSIDIIKTNNTKIICPDSCLEISSIYNDSIRVIPGNESEILGIPYKVTHAYTNEFYHHKDLGYCGYILEIEGYKVFHGGDSMNIPEYENYANEIDVMYMDLGHNKYTIFEEDAIKAIEVLKPKILVPVHTFDRNLDDFCKECNSVNPTTDIITEMTLYLI